MEHERLKVFKSPISSSGYKSGQSLTASKHISGNWATLGLNSTSMGDRFGTPDAAEKKTKPGSVMGACMPSRWAENSIKAYRLWERLDCFLDILLANAAKWSPRVLATWDPDRVEP